MKTDLKRKTMDKVQELNTKTMKMKASVVESFKDVFIEFIGKNGDGKENNRGTIIKKIPEPNKEVLELTDKFSDKDSKK